MSRLFLFAAALLGLAATSAEAHTGIGGAGGFGHGFAHPIGGLDHVLAMVAVGLLASQLGGRALCLVPLSFIAMMVVGGAVGMAGFGLPFAEVAIAMSVVVFGLAIASGLRLSGSAAVVLAGFFALFHGHAHGAEMPGSLSGLDYAAGFVAATALLHAGGIAIGLTTERLGRVFVLRLARMRGASSRLPGRPA